MLRKRRLETFDKQWQKLKNNIIQKKGKKKLINVLITQSDLPFMWWKLSRILHYKDLGCGQDFFI